MELKFVVLAVHLARRVLVGAEEYRFPDDDAQYCPSASATHRESCYSSKDGICVTTEDECTSLGGTYHSSGCGPDCNCCGDIGTRAPTATHSPSIMPTLSPSNYPTINPTINSEPDWLYESTCSDISSTREIKHCWETHAGICTLTESECVDDYGGTTSEDGCGFPAGKGCFCCHAASSLVPSLLPSTMPSMDPTINSEPDWLYESTCSDISSTREIKHCWEAHEGICTSTESECVDNYGGTISEDGCGFPAGKGCFCCHAANEFEPTSVPTLNPTVDAPDWAFETTCLNIASTREINHCWEAHAGVCTGSEEECTEVYSGTISTDGCSYPTGSGCFCCHAAFEFEPSSAPTPLFSGDDKKKKSSGLGLGILVLIVVIFCICILINCCLLFFFCCYKKDEEEDEEIPKKMLVDTYMQTDAVKKEKSPPKRVVEEITPPPPQEPTYFDQAAETYEQPEERAPAYKSYDTNAFDDFDDELSAPIPMPVVTRTFSRQGDRIRPIDDYAQPPPPGPKQDSNGPCVFCDDGSGRADQRPY